MVKKSCNYIIFLLLILLAAFCQPSEVLSAAVLPVKISFAQSSWGLTCAVRLDIPEDTHSYANEIGDEAGRPTVFELAVKDVDNVQILYPKGAAQRDLYSPEASVFVYEGSTYLFAKLPKEALGKPYTASLSLLLCSKRNCTPINQNFSGTIPTTLNQDVHEPWFEALNQLLQVQKPAVVPEILQTQSAEEAEKELPPLEDFALHLTPSYAESSLEIASLTKALLLGLIAGLILNFMPCVLPVLTFKITGMLLIGTQDMQQRIRKFRAHNICFAAGIISFFTLLAIVLAGADLIWGQFFQNQTLLVFLLVLIFLMGLSLLGVFSLPIIDLKVHEQTANPHLQSYLTGILTTFLATPCSGPLLGGVLGYALTQPFVSILTIFWFIGIGMALPYLIFSIFPRAVLLLPKPGAWMNVLEHIAGFFLLGTALYLLSILPEGRYISVLAMLLIISVAAWLWGQYCGPNAPKLRKHVVGLLGLVLVVLACNWVVRPVDEPTTWQPFSRESFSEQLGKKMLLVEFTADWCPNCKFMERTVLTESTLKSLKNDSDVTFIRADLTFANAEATYLLTKLGSVSIPVTAIFPKGANANAPIVLRDVYTTDLLTRSFAQARAQSN